MLFELNAFALNYNCISKNLRLFYFASIEMKTRESIHNLCVYFIASLIFFPLKLLDNFSVIARNIFKGLHCDSNFHFRFPHRRKSPSFLFPSTRYFPKSYKLHEKKKIFSMASDFYSRLFSFLWRKKKPEKVKITRSFINFPPAFSLCLFSPVDYENN